MDFRDLYKNRRIPTLSATVAKHYQDIITCRQEKQREFFWSKRGQPEIVTQKRDALEKKKVTRMEMLMKWKAEKLKKQEEEKKRSRPIFKVGVVQKKITGSPLIIEKKNCMGNLQKKNQRVVKSQIKANEKNYEGIMTRSKTRIQKILDENTIKEKKQLNAVKGEDQSKTDLKLNNKFCKVETGKIKRVNSVVFKVPEKVAALAYCNKLTFPDSPNITKKKNLIYFKPFIEETPFQASSTMSKMYIDKIDDVKNNVEFKPSQKELEVPKSSESKSLDSDAYNEIYFSPLATSKNKAGGKKETENKENEFHCKILSFREYIVCKTKMLLEKCEKWKNICTDIQGPSDIQDEIDSVIGKTKLLTSDKFLQFKDLIDKCDKGDPLINLDDLEGFKDWVSIEVEKINDDFEKLEKLKQNNWISETFSVENSKNKKKKICMSKKPPAKSNIRAYIQAARKILKSEKRNYSVEVGDMKNHNEIISTRTLTKNMSQSPADNNYPSNLNQLLPVNIDRHNRSSEMTMSSPANGILFTKQNSPVLRGSRIKNVENNKVKVQANIVCQNYEKESLKTIPNVLNSLKNHFNLKCDSENLNKGLNEKYFRRPEKDDKTPARRVLGEMNLNITPVRIMTRSKSD